MTETTYLGAAALGYLADVGAALSDLASPERDDLLEQVHEHLDAVVSEAGHDVARVELVERLGEPKSYANDLRTAAGLGAMVTNRGGVRYLFVKTLLTPGAINAAMWIYLRRLTPAWWAARGYLLAGLVLPWSFGLRGLVHGGTDFAGLLFMRWSFDDRYYLAAFYPNEWRLFWIVPIIGILLASIVVGTLAEHGSNPTRALNRILDVAGVLAAVLVPTWWAGPLMYDFVLRQ